LPIPPPSLTCPSPLCRLTLDQIVVSVGPYIFHNSPTRPAKSAANSWPSASPPTSPFICRLPCQPLSIISRQLFAVACRLAADDQQPTAADQRQVEFQRSDVERQRRQRRQSVVR